MKPVDLYKREVTVEKARQLLDAKARNMTDVQMQKMINTLSLLCDKMIYSVVGEE